MPTARPLAVNVLDAADGIWPSEGDDPEAFEAGGITRAVGQRIAAL
jgi:hypothetical protein